MLKLRIKERVADTQTIITAKLQQALAIFIHLSNAKMASTSGPRIVISTNSSVKVSKNEQQLSLQDFFDSSCQMIMEFVFNFYCRQQCWCICTNEDDQYC